MQKTDTGKHDTLKYAADIVPGQTNTVASVSRAVVHRIGLSR